MLRSRSIICFFSLLFSFSAFAQDHVGSGRSILFSGDDYIDMGNIYDNVALPVTITLWIYISPATPAGNMAILDSQDGLPAYSGFAMLVSKTPHVGVTYGDGQGGNNPAFRASKAAIVNSIDGRWIHIAGVMRGPGNMTIYFDGQNAGGNYEGTSTLPMHSNSPTENMHVGVFSSNGLTQFFRGNMDELRIWNKALTETEIRRDMCRKLNGDESGLIGYWDFDETSGNVVKDKTANHFDGTFMGTPQRVYSGAPLGDESVYIYPDSWNGVTLSLDNLTAEKITGSPYGIHIYKVNDNPSQTSGLNGTAHSPYYGIFLAEDPGGKKFDFKIDGPICGYYSRKDNSESTWTASTNTTGIVSRTELIWAETPIDFSLGKDDEICPNGTKILKSNIRSSGFEFTWQDGSHADSLRVDHGGVYWLTVKNNCGTKTDTIQVSEVVIPPIPNVITPNDDAFNQYLVIDPQLQDSRLDIVNRWGKRVFESPAYRNDWDAHGLAPGVYFYRLSNSCFGILKGSVHVLRP